MRKFISIGGYLLMVGGIVGLLATRSLISPLPVVIALQVVAILLSLWARITFGRRSFHLAANPTSGGLVTSGPYRFIRHPIYTSVCLFCASGIAAHWSSSAALLALAVALGAMLRINSEEALLPELYPEYREYAKR